MSERTLGLSVIIPVYNVENYVEECLDRIVEAVRQLPQMERVKVYLINDGSTDNSRELIEKYTKFFPSLFFLINQPNGGVAKARNQGLKQVNTNYLTFIDPDDYISIDYFTNIFEIIESNDYDLITFDIQNFWADTKDFIEVFEGIDSNVLESKWLVNGSLCCKVIKTSVTEGIEFTDGIIYEDTEFIYKIISKVSRYHYVHKCLYFYRVGRKNSITTNRKSNIQDIFKVLDNIYSFYQDNSNFNDENLNGLEYQFVKVLYWSNFYRQVKYAGYNIFDGAKRMSETKKFLEIYFPNWIENKLLGNSIYLCQRIGNNFKRLLPLIGSNIFGTYFVMFACLLHKRKKRK